MTKLATVIGFLSLFILATCDAKEPDLKMQSFLDAENKVNLQWGFDKKKIKFRVTAPTTGWVGLGFSPSGTMKGADILFGWSLDIGMSRVIDMHARRNGLPETDLKQDVLSSNVIENGTHTTMTFSRYLDTCDDEDDFRITEDTTRVIFAFGMSDPKRELPTWEDYHGAFNRGTKSLRLLDMKMPSVMKSKHDYIETKQHDILSKPFTIPKKNTYYHCFYHKLPDIPTKHHLIQFEAVITPGNVRNVHHITLFHCNESLVTQEMLDMKGEECYTEDQGDHWKFCAPVVVSWAIGMTEVALPRHVGFPLGIPGSPKIVRMEIHYDNPDLRDDIVDTSGLRLIYTSHLRKYDAAILLTGHDVWPTLFVPQGSKDFLVQGHCTKDCLENAMNEGSVKQLNVFGVFLHAHTASSGMILRHYRRGRELKPVARDLNYDFDYQESKILSKEIAIKRGDSIIMECLYDTTKRSLPTLGGLATTEEMCFGFMMYYPAVDLAYCQSTPLYNETYAALGATNLHQAYKNGAMKNWTDQSRKEFNERQLKALTIQICRKLSGPVKNVPMLVNVPTVEAKFKEKSRKCPSINKKNFKNSGKNRQRRETKNQLDQEISTRNDKTYTIIVGGSMLVALLVVLLFIFKRLN